MEAKARETLKGLSVTTLSSVRQTVAGLSGGQRQSVAVAKAVMWNSKLVILDEPTAALGVAQTAQVLALVKRLGEQGLAVILISHNLHDIFEVADSITVLRLGQNVAEYKRTETNAAAGRRGDHRRQAVQGARPAAGGGRMSIVTEPPLEAEAPARDTVSRVRAPLVDRRQVRRARLAADHRRPDRHRDRLPDAERPLPHRRRTSST